MTSQRPLASALFALLLASGLFAPLSAAPPAASLAGLRSDTVFYSAWLRNGEQLQRLLASNFAAKIREMPVMQMGLKQLQEYWENPPDLEWAMIKATLELPENRELQDMLRDAAENEVFVSGGPGYLKFMEFVNKLNAASRAGQLEQLGDLNPAELDPEKLAERNKANARKMVEIFLAHSDLMTVPDTLIGFRISDPARAERQLARLEKSIREMLQKENPELLGRLKKEQIGGRPFLVLRLDGEQLPLDQIRESLQGDNVVPPEDREKLVQALVKLKVAISIGVTGRFLLVHVGDSTKPLEQLGVGPRLFERPELAPLMKHQDRPVTQVSFVSSELAAASNQTTDLLKTFADGFAIGLQKAELPEDIRNDLAKDVSGFVDRTLAGVRPQGAALSFTYMTPRGYEQMAYAYGGGQGLDGSKPLSILQHLGGDPISFSAGRAANVGQGYEAFREFAVKATGYMERIAATKLTEEERRKYAEAKTALDPLFVRFDKATREMLVPGLKDGQGALVFDAKMLSPRWHPAMPPAARPLPFPELAYVVGVSDKQLVRKAADEYFDISRQWVRLANKYDPQGRQHPEPVPPTIEEAGGVTTAFYSLPEEWLLDRRIAPCAALGDRAAALAFAPETARRLVTPRPLKLDCPLVNATRPLAGVSHFNFPRFLEMFEPWVEYGIDEGMKLAPNLPNLSARLRGDEVPVADDDDAPAPAIPPTPEQIKAQMRVALSFFKCYRGSTSIVFQEEGALVTHSEWHYEDLPK